MKLNETGTNYDDIRTFNRYLVVGRGENGYELKGIREDAPESAINDFIRWYRENNRYENGRLRPEGIVRKSMIIPVCDLPLTRSSERAQATSS